ncbi:Ger(x)C family spore germination protein [Alteribacter keqinensis]|uniref:Ger(X)C family spore germination protein n=1 Tax=Alteribacter keqinensis TaxID=2483800 RepID=A0A3M7TX58_9BACI|nr:Ger(x)C family spore germination protein [Alteribacter keqinensis]RNA69859.1 Ger(x)C family spore germination protein [Alteribacter keqinensis]
MIKFAKWIITLAITVSICTGCGDKMELDQLAVVVAIGIDQVEDSEDFEVSFQIINPHGASARVATEGGGSEDASVFTFTTRGKTLVEAVDLAKNIAPRRLFFSHMYYIIIGENFARETGINRVFDFVERDQQMRMQFLAFIAKDTTAKDMLSVFTPLDENPAKSVRDRVMVASGSLGISGHLTLADAIRAYVKEDHHPILLGLRNISSENSDNTEVLSNIDEHSFSLDGLAVFKDDKLVDWMNTQESQGWVFLNNLVKDRTIFDTKCEGGYTGVRVHSLNETVKAAVKNGKPHFTISLTGKGYMLETSCDLDIGDPEDFKKIKEAVNDELRNEIQMTIDKSRELGFDVVGFSEWFHNQQPKKWKEWEGDWFHHLQEGEIVLNVDIDLTNTGMRFNSLNEAK